MSMSSVPSLVNPAAKLLLAADKPSIKLPSVLTALINEPFMKSKKSMTTHNPTQSNMFRHTSAKMFGKCFMQPLITSDSVQEPFYFSAGTVKCTHLFIERLAGKNCQRHPDLRSKLPGEPYPQITSETQVSSIIHSDKLINLLVNHNCLIFPLQSCAKNACPPISAPSFFFFNVVPVMF